MMDYILKSARQILCIALVTMAFNSALADTDQTCHPLSVNTCTLPFPSNFYTQPDTSSATGLRIDLKGNLFSLSSEHQFANFTSPRVFNGATGFSAAAPIMIELPEAFDAGSIPKEGGNTVLVFDQTTGQRLPIRTQRFDYALNKRFEQASHIIEIYPRARFEFGHRYIALVTNQLLAETGQAMLPHPAVSELISGSATWDGAADMADALNTIHAYGLDKNNVVSFVEFSIGDEATNNDPLFALIDQVTADPHPVRNLKTQQINVWPYSASVTGQIRLSDFRNEDDGSMPFHNIQPSRDYWADFILMLPIASKHGAVPVAIYGHGLGVIKETMLLTVAYPNAEKGIATIAIDQPNHGSRSKPDGGDIQSLLTPEKVTHLAGMMTQSTLDMASVMTALKTSLANLDVAPAKDNWWHRIWYSGGINTPDIDSNHIIYQGTSMGGVLGTSFVATAPDLETAFVQVTGVGMTNILSHSTLFETFGFNNMIPASASGGEAALFMHALQHQVDHGDAINFAHYIRNPIKGRESRGLIVQYGLGDKVVFNGSTEALAEIAQLPLMTPAIKSIPHLAYHDEYQNGYGLVQTSPLLPTAGLLDHILGHASFIRADSILALKLWVDDFFQPSMQY